MAASDEEIQSRVRENCVECRDALFFSATEGEKGERYEN